MDAIFKVRGGLVQAVRELRKRGTAIAASAQERDIGGGYITLFSLLATVIIAILYYTLTESVGMTALTTVIMIIMSFFFTAVASYIVGLVGNSNSPVSGIPSRRCSSPAACSISSDIPAYRAWRPPSGSPPSCDAPRAPPVTYATTSRPATWWAPPLIANRSCKSSG